MTMSNLNDAAVLLEIGRRLRRERLNADLTQQQLAQQVGLSRKTIQNAEDGKNCSLESIIRMLRGLNILDQLDAFLPDPGPSPIQLARLRGKERQRASGRRGSAAKKDDYQW